MKRFNKLLYIVAGWYFYPLIKSYDNRTKKKRKERELYFKSIAKLNKLIAKRQKRLK